MSVRLLFCLLLLLLGACASKGPANHVLAQQLLHDELFEPVEGLVQPQQVFALPIDVVSELKRNFERQRIASSGGELVHRWLANQLNAADGGFRYQDNDTRIASDSYRDRAGNCMSLVVLATAMADALGVAVDFQDILVPPIWDRQGDFYLVNGHVNLRLLPNKVTNVLHFSEPILIDFLPAQGLRGYQRVKIDRSMLLAMFFNNMAAEALVAGHYHKAYGFIRLSLAQTTAFVPALNTLAVLYRYRGRADLAELVYRTALALEPENMTTLYNLALILSDQDRFSEWADIHKILELARIRNPYYYYDMAEQALSAHEYQQAVSWYLQAVEKADYRHEFYFGLSKAYWATGDSMKARQSMHKAMQLSRDDSNKRRYQAKLDAMVSH